MMLNKENAPHKEDKLMSNVNKWVAKDDLYTKLSLVSLHITVLLVIIGQWRIYDHDPKILYSLGMIIASSVSKYGTDLTYQNIKSRKKRWWPYVILWVFGLIGLIS